MWSGSLMSGWNCCSYDKKLFLLSCRVFNVAWYKTQSNVNIVWLHGACSSSTLKSMKCANLITNSHMDNLFLIISWSEMQEEGFNRIITSCYASAVLWILPNLTREENRDEKGKEIHDSRGHILLLISMYNDSCVNTHLQAVSERSVSSHNHLSL